MGDDIYRRFVLVSDAFSSAEACAQFGRREVPVLIEVNTGGFYFFDPSSQRLITDGDPKVAELPEGVRYELAVRSCSHHALLILSKDSSDLVRRGVALNFFAGPEVLSFLANDQSVDVRRNVSLNLNTPKEVLDRLRQKDSLDVVEPTTEQHQE